MSALSDPEDNLFPNNGNKEDDSGGEGYRSDEAIEDTNFRDDDDATGNSTKRTIDPKSAKKKTVRNPQPRLNAERLKGPKGIHTIEQHFADFKFRGKGYEKSDLNKLMKKLEYWSHRLYPKFEFDDCLSKLETLGTKKPVQTHLTKIRLGMLTDDDMVENIAEEDDEVLIPDSAPIDEFDALIAEELDKQRHSVTPQRPYFSFHSTDPDTTAAAITAIPTHVPSLSSNIEITTDMKERIERNRQMAIQKRLARFEAEKAKKQVMEQEADESEMPIMQETNDRTPEKSIATDSISDE